MMNPSEHYDRLHDHMSAIARERDWACQQRDGLQAEIQVLVKENQELTDELVLAYEALARYRTVTQ